MAEGFSGENRTSTGFSCQCFSQRLGVTSKEMSLVIIEANPQLFMDWMPTPTQHTEPPQAAQLPLWQFSPPLPVTQGSAALMGFTVGITVTPEPSYHPPQNAAGPGYASITTDTALPQRRADCRSTSKGKKGSTQPRSPHKHPRPSTARRHWPFCRHSPPFLLSSRAHWLWQQSVSDQAPPPSRESPVGEGGV